MSLLSKCLYETDSGSILHVHVASQFVPYVNLFQPRSICSNLGQFVPT